MSISISFHWVSMTGAPPSRRIRSAWLVVQDAASSGWI